MSNFIFKKEYNTFYSCLNVKKRAAAVEFLLYGIGNTDYIQKALAMWTTQRGLWLKILTNSV